MSTRSFKHLFGHMHLEYFALIWNTHYCKDIDNKKFREEPQSFFHLHLSSESRLTFLYTADDIEKHFNQSIQNSQQSISDNIYHNVRKRHQRSC